ncbi:MAG: hypothetical protein KME40_15795 [Komarekiella atlantica HA4396-MV6]|nr:hypothetical protein [Komarekiella atlantica HA4396-MV6]
MNQIINCQTEKFLVTLCASAPTVRLWRLPLGEVLMPTAGCANGGNRRSNFSLREP